VDIMNNMLKNAIARENIDAVPSAIVIINARVAGLVVTSDEIRLKAFADQIFNEQSDNDTNAPNNDA